MNRRPPEYSWQKEYYAWAEGKKRKSTPVSGVDHLKAHPKAKLSDVLNVLSKLLGSPEIVAQWKRVMGKVEPGKEFSLWQDEDYSYACQLTNEYSRWYRMKNRLDDHWDAYSLLPALLRDIHLGIISREDDGALISYLKQSTHDYLVDDVNLGGC